MRQPEKSLVLSCLNRTSNNSLLPCLAIELLKVEDLDKAFDLLYELQSLFFLKGST